MKAVHNLPEGYKDILSIDLQKDKKLFLLINILATVIIVVMAVPMHFLVPITSLFDISKGLKAYTIRFVVLFVAMIAYIVLHELVHGITMKILGTKKIKYGFTGLLAYAGSDDYYNKKSYITIALAPIVIWGVVLAIINIFVSSEWFWVVYFIQLLNVSGAAGDMYVTVKFAKLPKDILVRDYGVSMTVYSAE